ncbi:MAG: GntR family transcriptional regulator, partial [Bauldia litoralis]
MSDGAVERAVAAIRERLLSGQFVAGQRLIEKDLVEITGIGRSSVLEALQRLATEGTVDLIRNKGAVVRSLSRKEVADILHIRENLEGMAAELAAGAIGEDGNRSKLEAAIE